MERNSEILIYNSTKDKISQKFLKESVKKILRYLKKQKKSFSLILVSSSVMKQKNHYWRKKNQTTTVLTFSEGDIFLCPEEIKKQALKRKISQKKFYQLLLVHSILHLFGYTHDGKKDTKIMECLEAKILHSLKN
jgi:probable rRNA maturation factor